LQAPQTLYCTPRIICCPGYTGQLANSLDTMNVTTRGVGYIPGASYQIAFALGNGETNGANAVLPVAHAVADSNGYIDDLELFIDSWGAWFRVPPVATLPAPDGPPVVAKPATGQFIFSSNPGIGATVVLNSSVIRFIAPTGTPGPMDCKLGYNLGDTLVNLM